MAKRVYLLEHRKRTAENLYDIKTIGWFSAKKKAKRARKKYKKLPGFRDTPDCFVIEKHKVDETVSDWTEIQIV